VPEDADQLIDRSRRAKSTSTPTDVNEQDEEEELDTHVAMARHAVPMPMRLSPVDTVVDPLRVTPDHSEKDLPSQRRQQLSLAQALLQVLLPYRRNRPTVPGLLELCTRLQAELDAGRPGLPGPSDVQFVNLPAKSKGGSWQRASRGGGKSKADTPRTMRS